jgi:hypothetical protein
VLLFGLADAASSGIAQVCLDAGAHGGDLVLGEGDSSVRVMVVQRSSTARSRTAWGRWGRRRKCP